jgi:hypothetical protein
MLFAALLNAFAPIGAHAGPDPRLERDLNRGLQRNGDAQRDQRFFDERERERRIEEARRQRDAAVQALSSQADEKDRQASELFGRGERLFEKLANPYARTSTLDDALPQDARQPIGRVGGIPVFGVHPDARSEKEGTVGSLQIAKKLFALSHAFEIGITPALVDEVRNGATKPGRLPNVTKLVEEGTLDLQARGVMFEKLATKQDPYLGADREKGYPYACQLYPKQGDPQPWLNQVGIDCPQRTNNAGQEIGSEAAYLVKAAVYGFEKLDLKPQPNQNPRLVLRRRTDPPAGSPSPSTVGPQEPQTVSPSGAAPAPGTTTLLPVDGGRVRSLAGFLDRVWAPPVLANGNTTIYETIRANTVKISKPILEDQDVVNLVRRPVEVRAIHDFAVVWYLQAKGNVLLDGAPEPQPSQAPQAPQGPGAPGAGAPRAIPPASGSLDGKRTFPWQRFLLPVFGFHEAWASNGSPFRLEPNSWHFHQPLSDANAVRSFVESFPKHKHYLYEASQLYKEGFKQAEATLKDLKSNYERDASAYKTLADRVDALRSEAEQLRNRAQQLAQQDPRENERGTGSNEQANSGGEGGGPQKGGGGGGDAGQRAKLDPPEPAKIPNQTEFPPFQFPQRPEEAPLDPSLVQLATRGVTNNARLGDLGLGAMNGNQIFQGAPGSAPAQRANVLGFRPRNLLANGVPALQPGDAPGGAIANGGASTGADAAAAGGGGGVPNGVGGGGGGGDGGLGGNFENGIGYDPNGAEGARQRQTFSEFVSYGAGSDAGGGSSSDGDSGPPLAAQIASGPSGGGAGEAIVLGRPGDRRGAKGNAARKGVAALGILSYVTNMSPLVAERVKKIDFKEAFAKANAAEASREPASLRGVAPSLASPSGPGDRILDAVRRDGDSAPL